MLARRPPCVVRGARKPPLPVEPGGWPLRGSLQRKGLQRAGALTPSPDPQRQNTIGRTTALPVQTLGQMSSAVHRLT